MPVPGTRALAGRGWGAHAPGQKRPDKRPVDVDRALQTGDPYGASSTMIVGLDSWLTSSVKT